MLRAAVALTLALLVVHVIPMIDSNTGLALSHIVGQPRGWALQRTGCATCGSNCDTECNDDGCDLELNSCSTSCDAPSACWLGSPASRSAAHELTAAFRSPPAHTMPASCGTSVLCFGTSGSSPLCHMASLVWSCYPHEAYDTCEVRCMPRERMTAGGRG